MTAEDAQKNHAVDMARSQQLSIRLCVQQQCNTDNATGNPQPVYMRGTGVQGTTASTSTTVSSSANPSTSGQSVTFTATVTGPSGSTAVPTGSVSFLDGTTTLGIFLYCRAAS